MWPLTLTLALLTADGGDCERAISRENTEALFAAFKAMQGEGCALHGVATDSGVTRVTWKKGETVLPALTVEPSACARAPTFAGPEFAFTAPAPLAAECPGVVEQTRAALARERFGGAVVKVVGSGGSPGGGAASPAPETPWALRLGLAVVVVVVVAVRLAVARRSSRRERHAHHAGGGGGEER